MANYSTLRGYEFSSAGGDVQMPRPEEGMGCFSACLGLDYDECRSTNRAGQFQLRRKFAWSTAFSPTKRAPRVIFRPSE